MFIFSPDKFNPRRREPTGAQKCHDNFNLSTAISISSRQLQFDHSNHLTIKFTTEISEEKTNFLETTIFKAERRYGIA